MSHAPFEGWLAIYPDLTPAERDAVDAHLRDCPQCAARLTEYCAIQRDLQERPTPTASERLRQGFYAAVAMARQQERHTSRRGSLRRMVLAVGDAAAWVVVAVVAAVLVVGVALAWRPLAKQAWPGGTAVPAHTPGADLVGSEWVLTALSGRPLVEGTHITLDFAAGEASGFAGCNAYGLEYTAPAEGALSFGLGSITVQLCPEPQGVMEQEQAYWEVLRSATSYRLADESLEMANAAGEAILTFRKVDLLPMDPAGLVGTEWQLVSWDGHPPIEGSPITIAFARGEYSGQAGCRGYTGTYEASGNHIRFPMLAMTETEPQCSPALQQQEGAYTTALGWTNHYRLEGDQLELMTARGETLVYTAVGARPSPTAPAGEPAVTVARLERVEGLCCPPVFAPDGQTYLTIADGGSLQVHSLSGGPARELPVTLPAGPEGGSRLSNAVWTPDGMAIVVTYGPPSEVPHDVYLVNQATGAARRLGETYSPQRLVFDARGRLILTTPAAYLALDLASGGSSEVPGIWPRLNAEQPEIAFSPDGRSVAALEGDELSIVDLTTGRKTSITTSIHPRWHAGFAWRDSGRELAYATGARGAAPELWVVGADGTGARRVATREGDRDTGGAYAGLAWLPGTPYIVYEFVPWSNVATLQGEYQVVSAEGGPAKTLFSNGLGLNLSPDGRLISFVRDLEGAEETGNWVAVLEYGGAAELGTPTPESSAMPIPVDGWVGTVHKLDSTAQFDDYFQRLDGERYGIDGSAAGLTSQIEDARQQGTAIAVWGRLLTGVPDVNGRQIVVERLEVASVPGTAAPTVTPVATGASIRVSGWSPDGQWLAFWRADDSAVLAYQSPTATLHFYNARSQETCSCELQTTSACPQLTWLDDGEVVVWDGEVAKQGAPCRRSFRPVDATAPDPASLSPGGSYRVSTAYQGQGDVGLLATSTFADAASGRPAMAVTSTMAWGDSPGLPTGPAGQWVTDRLFLINYSLDRGPLLVDVAEGRVIEVMRELFGLRQAQSRDLGFAAVGQAVAGGDAYHIVLGGGAGTEAAFPPLRLYHSETGEVEELPSKYAWGPAFSADGRWLLLDQRLDRWVPDRGAAYESPALWVRAVDARGSPGHLVAEGQGARWSSDWTRVAMAGPGVNYGLPNVISVYGFPEGRLLGSWATGDYAVQPDAWSPDGRWLAMSGNVPGEWKYGLFVVQP